MVNHNHADFMLLYRDGYTDSEIAERLGMSCRNVCYWRKKQNLPPNRPERIRKRQELYDAGKTDAEIAKMCDVSPFTIWKWRKKQNLPRNQRRKEG